MGMWRLRGRLEIGSNTFRCSMTAWNAKGTLIPRQFHTASDTEILLNLSFGALKRSYKVPYHFPPRVPWLQLAVLDRSVTHTRTGGLLVNGGRPDLTKIFASLCKKPRCSINLLTGEPSHLWWGKKALLTATSAQTVAGNDQKLPPNVPTHVDCSTNSHGFVFWHLCVYGIVCLVVLVSYWKWHLMMANNGSSRNSWDCKKKQKD